MTLINYIIYEDTKSNGKCRLTVSEELKAYNQLPLQIGFPIGHPIVPAFNEYYYTLILVYNCFVWIWYILKRFFLRINGAGIIDLNKKKFFPSTMKCRTDIPPETKTRSLTLLDMTFAFVILGFGLVVSVLAFLAEILAKFYFSSINRVIKIVNIYWNSVIYRNINTRTTRSWESSNKYLISLYFGSL